MVKFFFICVLIFSSSYSKVYDCFKFFNELDILELRLNELCEIVDKFVLVEACYTQTGKPKPFYFDENSERFKKFHEKIIHIKLYDDVSSLSDWERENWQRNQIMRGLTDCIDEDIIIISDVDEIPKKSVIKNIVESEIFPIPSVLINKMQFFHFNQSRENGLDWENKPWYGSTICTLNFLKNYSPQILRDARSYALRKILNAGWHFSWMGGVKQMRKKALSVVEGKMYDFENKTDDEILFWMNTVCPKIEPITTESDFPDFLKTNYEYFFNLGLIAI